MKIDTVSLTTTLDINKMKAKLIINEIKMSSNPLDVIGVGKITFTRGYEVIRAKFPTAISNWFPVKDNNFLIGLEQPIHKACEELGCSEEDLRCLAPSSFVAMGPGTLYDWFKWNVVKKVDYVKSRVVNEIGSFDNVTSRVSFEWGAIVLSKGHTDVNGREGLRYYYLIRCS